MAVEPANRPNQSDYKAILELVHAIVWRADARTFHTTFASKEAEEILGYPLAQWLDVPGFWAAHIHPEDREWVLALTSAATHKGEFHDFEYRMIAADGRVVWFRNIVNVVSRGGEPSELVGVTVDITARKKAEQEADRLRQEMLRVARAATLGEVAATLAHEVNQPLGAIAANAETLQRMLGGPQRTERLAAIVEDILADARRAGEIIHRVHAFLERQPVQHRRVDVRPLVDGVLATVRSLLTTRRIEWTTDIPAGLPAVSGDAVQIQQVLLNLIRNAVDAIVERSPAARSIAIAAARTGADRIEVSVADTGSGFAPAIVPRLFEPFATTKDGGIGMGLAVSRRIIQSHGGEIRAQNNADGGATVAFTVPVHEAEARTA